VPEALHQALKQIASDNDIGLNDLVRWLFCDAVKRIECGDLVLPIEQYVVSVRRLSE